MTRDASVAGLGGHPELARLADELGTLLEEHHSKHGGRWELAYPEDWDPADGEMGLGVVDHSRGRWLAQPLLDEECYLEWEEGTEEEELARALLAWAYRKHWEELRPLYPQGYPQGEEAFREDILGFQGDPQGALELAQWLGVAE